MQQYHVHKPFNHFWRLLSYRTSSHFGEAIAVLPKDLQRLKADIIEELEEDSDDEATSSGGEGFVSENITYMVTDNLEIMPSTTIRSINVLNKFSVATLADLESNDIIVSITQILQLVQSAFQTVASTMFPERNDMPDIPVAPPF